MVAVLFKLARQMIKGAPVAEDSYDELCFKEPFGVLTPAETARLERLKAESGLIVVRNAKGIEVMAIGTREEQIDNRCNDIMRRMALKTATPADVRRLHKLQAERVARMTSSRGLKRGTSQQRMARMATFALRHDLT